MDFYFWLFNLHGMSLSPKNIAFFDFDGTLTKSDSLKHFIFWYFNWPNLLVKTLWFTPYFFYYRLLLGDNSIAKEKLFAIFWGGVSEAIFNEKCSKFANEILPKQIKKQAFRRLEWHLNQGDDVFVVSASVENYLAPLTQNWGVQLIGTKLSVENNAITGKFKGKNCYGDEKSSRIHNAVNLKKYEKIYAYGDSKGDQEMLELADFAYFRKFG